ncbi:hypothetical protein ALC56_09615 [Trachymyrmex septentrionalis]|uniref:MICOS complex subunit MIC13 n=1 Tax=Trachymyrmex septentrionalis TaxID=34720 RepID=A0A195F6I9_9HYME|nr:hypothetical protein ALC56_09615 [Trachymyrmex septentrionalis]
MKRGTKCVVQTINLSNPKTCKRPKVKRVTSANVNSRNRASARSAAVKVYSWKDAQWRYPSKVREDYRSIQFSVKSCGLSLCRAFSWSSRDIDTPRNEMMVFEHLYGIVLYRTVVFFIKGAIVACLICWTCTEGLWGSNIETEELYYRMMSVIFPDQQVNKQPFSFLDISNRRNLGTLSQCVADLLSYDFRLNGDRHRRRGRNNRARLRDKNGNGRENVAARTWKDVALRRRLTRSLVETRSAKPDREELSEVNDRARRAAKMTPGKLPHAQRLNVQKDEHRREREREKERDRERGGEGNE